MHPLFRGTLGHKCPPVPLDDWAALSQASLRPSKGIYKLLAGWAPPQCIYCTSVTFCIFWGSGGPCLIAEVGAGKWGASSIKYLGNGDTYLLIA